MTTLTIGQLAHRCGISRSTLLYYEEQGLLAPARSAAGYRRYGEADVARAEQIRAWRATGMDIPAIAALLRGASHAGLDDAAMERWHALFEQQARQAHETFPRSLGLSAPEIEHIRSWSKRMGV